MSSSSNLLHKFFQKKRRRSRSPVTADSTLPHQVHPVDRNQQNAWTRRRAYYRRCHELALQDPSIGILQRHSQESSPVVPHASPIPTAQFVDPWTRTLPYWLLMLPLYIHVDTMAQTSYAQLLAYTRALEKERNGLYQDYIKVQDRYRRFVQHVKTRNAQWDREKAKAAPAPTNTNSSIVMTNTNAEVPKPKTKSRRVTASPGGIRPEPMETNQAGPQIALHSPQHEAHDEANTSNKIPSPIISKELNKLSTSKPSYASKDILEQEPLIPTRRQHNPMNPLDDSHTAISSHRPVAPDKSGHQTTRSTGTIQGIRKQAPDLSEPSRVSSHTTKQRWISSRSAKEFIAYNTEQGLPIVHPTNRPVNSAPPPPKDLVNRAIQEPATSVTNPQLPSKAPYCEVVRKKVERQALKPYTCKECGKFIDAIMEEDKDGVYNRHELMCASRHRHRFTPPDTPPDFWELSFIDERDARLQQAQQQE